MKKILMKHDENVSEVVNKFALENSKDINIFKNIIDLDENKKEKLEKIINLKL